jgi:hypothetical protein
VLCEISLEGGKKIINNVITKFSPNGWISFLDKLKFVFWRFSSDKDKTNELIKTMSSLLITRKRKEKNPTIIDELIKVLKFVLKMFNNPNGCAD